jgi:hypothetical protein
LEKTGGMLISIEVSECQRTYKCGEYGMDAPELCRIECHIEEIGDGIECSRFNEDPQGLPSWAFASVGMLPFKVPVYPP